MHDYESSQRAPVPLKGAQRIAVSFALFIAALACAVPIYGGWLSGGAAATYRFGLALFWGVLALAAARSHRFEPGVSVLLSLFGVSLGLALAYVVGDWPLQVLSLSTSTPQGAAAAKIFSEVVPVCAAILLAAVLARRSPESFGLRGGRVWLSLALGLAASVPLLIYAGIDPAGDIGTVMALPRPTVLSWLPWIVLFSAANGFMEELWFRGSWFGSFRELVGSSAAMHVTSVAFCAMHVIVYWGDLSAVALLGPVWLFMGYAYAVIVRKTGSLWGPVLAHAIADVIYVLIAYGSRGGL